MAKTDHVSRAHAMHNASSANYWIECGIWYGHKLQAEEEGRQIGKDSSASIRGRRCHEVAEASVDTLLEMRAEGIDWEENDPVSDIVRLHGAKIAKQLTEEDLVDVEFAVRGAMELIEPGSQVGLEVNVPLSHEPESTGAIDVMAYREVDEGGVYLLDHILIADHKFGAMAVSPNSYQLRIYAANSVKYLIDQGVDVHQETRIKLAIIQPAVSTEPLVRWYKAGDLLRWQIYVEQIVENQINGTDRRPPASLKTCDWCDFAKVCSHRHLMIEGLMSTFQGDGLSKEQTEEIVRSANSIKRLVDEAVSEVKKNEKDFPNWTRFEVSNAEPWSPLLDESEIVSRLVAKGASKVQSLRSPKQIRDANPNPKITKLVDEMSGERTTHIRLKEGAPNKDTPKKSPPKRTKTAAKKAAKKKSAKKAARKKN